MLNLEKNKLKRYINNFYKGNVLVIGDVILDEYIEGSPERISREAPVLILEQTQNSYALGGASNAANNINALGAKCSLVGIVGDDRHANDFKKECQKRKINPLLITDKSRPTTVKTRFISTSHKHASSGASFKQQVLRLDKLSKKQISSNIEKKIIETINKNIKSIKCILLSDYDLGICTEPLIRETISLGNKNNIPVIVDAQGNLTRFQGAFLFTPNQPDTEKEVGFEIRDKNTLIKAGSKLLDKTKARYILITRGGEGMALFSVASPKNPFLIPAFNVSEVFDVTGAGDTVAGTIATAISIGCPIKEACILGNLAASLVVKKYGTATTSVEELKDSLV